MRKKIVTLLIVLLCLVLLVLPASGQSGTIRLMDGITPFGDNLANGTDIENAFTEGLVFQSSQPGQVVGVMVFHTTADSGTHNLDIWDAGGNNIAHGVTNSISGVNGWYPFLFAEPVPVQANQEYMVSYDENNNSGSWYFCALFNAPSSFTNGPLSALRSAYHVGYGYPEVDPQSGTYCVDVLFQPESSAPGTTTPTITPTPQNIAVVQLATGEAPATLVIERNITYGEIAVVVAILVLLAFLVILAAMLLPRKYL